MAIISGIVRNHIDDEPLAGVVPLLEKGDLTTFVPFGEGKAIASASASNGEYEVSYEPEEGTYKYVRLRFVGPDGQVREVVTSSDQHIWDRTQPPTVQLDVWLEVPLPEPDRSVDDGGPATTPDVVAGTVRDTEGEARAGVDVRIYGRSHLGERLLSASVTLSDGAFIFDELAGAAVRSMRLEFGPAAEPTDPVSGTLEWNVDDPPSAFEYVLDLPTVAPPATSSVEISGTVRWVDGTPLPAAGTGQYPVELKVLSRKLGRADSVLATLSPGIDGSYSTTVSTTSEGLSFVVVCRAEIPAGSGQWEELARSRLIAGAPGRVTVDLTVTDDRLRTRAQADSASDVDSALVGAGVSDPDTVTEGDEELLSEELSLPREQVQRHVAAIRLKKQIEAVDGDPPIIPLEIYDALLAVGFPRTPRPFCRRTARAPVVEGALREAVRIQVLPSAALEQLDVLVPQLTSLITLYDQTPGQADSLATLIRFVATTAALTDAEIATLVERWHSRTSPEDFWNGLDTSPPDMWDENTVEAVRRAIAILDVTLRQPETAQAFQASHPEAPASWTAEIGLRAGEPGGWDSLAASLPESAIPSWVTGTTLADRRSAWAEVVYLRAEERYPWPALRGDMLRALDVDSQLGTDDLTDTKAFLTAQRKSKWFEALPEEFHLGDSYIPAFEPAPSAPVAVHLSAFQRLFSLVPLRDAWNVMRVLWLAGFRSARDISRLGQQRYLYLLEQASQEPVPYTVPRTLALAIWRRARRRTQRAQNYWRSHHPTHQSSHSQFTHADEDSSSSGETKPEAAGDVAKLYVQALCGCEHCQSVLSPSAYFVDTLFWLQDRNLLDPLLAVRPDLEHLELDCENTETALPYSDLLIELLEQIVAAAPIAELPHATEGETSALLAYPEHVDRPEAAQAYQTLKTSVWPRVLPYHIALDEVQTYLDSAGVPHPVLIEVFDDLADTPVSAVDLAVLELGGTTSGAAMILAGGGAHPEVWWGFAGPTTGYRDTLYLLPELLERGQIDQFDLVLDLMRTRYLNADARLGVVLSPEAPDGVDACDVANLAVLRDKAPAASQPDYVKPDAWLFARMAAFLRLLDWTGWTPLTLDKALHALGVAGATPGTADEDAAPDPGVQITSERLEGLQAIAALMAHTGLSPEELCSWWTGLDTYLDRQNREGRPVVPLYDQHFLDPFVANESGAMAFALNASRTELATTDPASLVDTEPVALSGALRVDIGQMQAAAALLGAKGVSLQTDITSLWHLFRWTSLSRAARLTVEQVEQQIRITGLDPFAETPSGVPDPTVAWRWFQALAQLRQHDLSVGGISWVFGHVGSELAKLGPTDADIEAVLAQLQVELISLRAELSSAQPDEPTVRAALEEIGLQAPTIHEILEVLAWEPPEPPPQYSDALNALDVLGPWVDDLQALKDDLPEPSAEVDVDARMSVLLVHLQAATLIRLQRELALGALEAAFEGMTRAHLDVLDRVEFTGLTDFENPIEALHGTAEAGWNLEGAPGVTAAEAGPAHDALHLVAKLAHLVSALSLDVATLEEWLTDATAVGAPPLTDLPVVEDPSRLINLWASLGPALKWFDLDRRFRRPAPAASDIRAALRTGSARAALAMIAERQDWDLAPVGALAKAMGVASARLTVPPGGVPASVAITVDGVRIVVTDQPSAGELLTQLALAIDTAIPWLDTTTEDSEGGSPAGPADAVALVLTHDDPDPSHATFDVVTSALVVEQALHEVTPFAALLERWEILARLGLDLPTALGFVTADPSRERAGEARRVARNQYPSDAAWSAVGRDLRDEIRRRQQTALYAAVRALPDGPKTDADFYGKYFVDPGMDPCLLTTRLVLATGSVQTYINRCLLGQVIDPVSHKPVAFSSDEEEEWRGWRSTYRMWEAARKVFMYPENWLEPSLRVERSPEYDALETRLQTEGLDARTAEEAFRAYLSDILPYGNPLLACMTEDADRNLHLLARTGTQAEQLNYRMAERMSAGRYRWGAWERLPFPVPQAEGAQLAMYALGETLFVVWTTVAVLEDDNGTSMEVRLHFAVRSGTQWSTPQECHFERHVWEPIPRLLMYEHISQTSSVPSGLYVTLEYTVPDNVQAHPVLPPALVLRWSSTLRQFLKVDTDVLDGDSVWDDYYGDGYRFESTSDARFVTIPRGGTEDSDRAAVTLAGVTSRSRLHDADLMLIAPEAVEVITAPREADPLEILIPPNYAYWGGGAPFAVVHGTRSYLVRKR